MDQLFVYLIQKHLFDTPDISYEGLGRVCRIEYNCPKHKGYEKNMNETIEFWDAKE